MEVNEEMKARFNNASISVFKSRDNTYYYFVSYREAIKIKTEQFDSLWERNSNAIFNDIREVLI